MKTNFQLPEDYTLAFNNGRAVTLCGGTLELCDENGDVFTFGYVGFIFPEDIENFLASVAADDNENDWICALEEDSTRPHSPLFQV